MVNQSEHQKHQIIHGLVREAREELFEKLMVVTTGVDREVDASLIVGLFAGQSTCHTE